MSCPAGNFAADGSMEPAKEWKPSPRVLAFLAAYRATCSITRAAKAAGISREAHYRQLERSPEYKAAFEASTVEAVQTLEDAAVRRAVEGVARPLFYHGSPVLVRKDPSNPDCEEYVQVFEREYSDSLLLALLKAKKPKEYRERVEHEVGLELSKKFSGTFEDLLGVYRDLITKKDEDEK